MVYVDIVNKYLKYVNKNLKDDIVDSHGLQELLRHSLCMGLGLQSNPCTEIAEKYASDCSKYILKGIDVSGWTVDYRMGVVEACIKSVYVAYIASKEVK